MKREGERETGFADRGIRIDRVLFRRADRDGRAAETEFGELRSDLLELRFFHVEDRKFDPVVTDSLELFEQPEMFLGDVRSPEEQIHTVLHW